jgi:hypothetical protein
VTVAIDREQLGVGRPRGQRRRHSRSDAIHRELLGLCTVHVAPLNNLFAFSVFTSLTACAQVRLAHPLTQIIGDSIICV